MSELSPVGAIHLVAGTDAPNFQLSAPSPSHITLGCSQCGASHLLEARPPDGADLVHKVRFAAGLWWWKHKMEVNGASYVLIVVALLYCLGCLGVPK